MSEDRLLKHGGRLRVNEIASKIKELGFEKGVVQVLEALTVRDTTLGQETQQLAEAIVIMTQNLEKVIDVMGIHGEELIRLKGLDQSIKNTHPDEGH